MIMVVSLISIVFFSSNRKDFALTRPILKSLEAFGVALLSDTCNGFEWEDPDGVRLLKRK